MPMRKPKTKEAKKEAMHNDMSRFKRGTLKSGSGKKVTDRKQAIAIGLKQSGQSKKDSPKKREKRLEGKEM
jgi:hypothetical protein